MQDKGLSEFKLFLGNLQAGSDIAPIDFLARINGAGEVEFDFCAIVLTRETNFIKEWWNGEGSRPGYFSLSGKAEDGTEFKTEDLHFNSLGECFNEAESRMNPIGGCSRAEFRRKLTVPASKPTLCMRVKGFQNVDQLNSKCDLGKVVMNGGKSIEDPDIITGYIEVQSDREPTDLTAWHAEAEKLLEHIRRVMSFASAATLKAPIIELFSGDDLKVVALSQTRQATVTLRIFHHLNQQPVFDAAVNSFFNPPFEAKNLFFAIEWFAMDATYNEVRLVNAMTALENLVASNLDESDKSFFLEKEFDKRIAPELRKALRESIEEEAVTTDEAKAARDIMLKGLYDNLTGVNRRSIFQKLKILAKRWAVPLDGVGDDKIKNAIKVRNLIVHRGHYYDDSGKGGTNDLWEHVTVVREIVVLFLLTAIGYRGGYLSYIGGCHVAQFPPG